MIQRCPYVLVVRRRRAHDTHRETSIYRVRPEELPSR
jgi:hypothetical protein